jgi:predicted lipoprotein with Yx(FWY)xxD motif
VIRPTLVLLAALAALVAGCGDDDANGGQGSTQSDAAMERKAEQAAMKADDAMKAKGTLVKAVDSEYGRVVADGKGEAFYLFDKEDEKRSECYGDCAKAWPPVLTKGEPRAGKGAKKGKLGTTRRRNGKIQVTYSGHPLYYYKDDSPGNILCQNVDEFGGLWLVVKPNGRAVR